MMQVKKCKKCGEEKSIDQFGRKANGFQFACKTCANDISKEWYAKNKNDKNYKNRIYAALKRKEKYLKSLVNHIKQELKCCFCSEGEAVCLDFHHTSDDKNNNVSSLIRLKNFKSIIAEIEKCLCVCSNCHRKIHAGIIDCKNKLIEKTKIADLINSFQLENPWIVKREREKKPVVIKPCHYCDKPTSNNKYCSIHCCNLGFRKIKRPSRETLLQEIKKHSINFLSKKYSVDQNTVHKWLKYYEKYK